MKWLLITTRNTNPGDEFARMGVQRAIWAADPKPEFILLNKESPEIHAPVEFDRAVICGMPLFWNLPLDWPLRDCRDIDWWAPLIRGWISRDPRKVCAIGVGDVMTPKWEPTRPGEFEDAVREAWHRMSFLTLRAPIPGIATPIVSCCPSAFEFWRASRSPQMTVCNFMVNGGHFHHPVSELRAWQAIEQPLSDLLRDRGFTFVAHNRAEADLASFLGWPDYRVRRPLDANAAADIYKHASMFIGNRVHGGAVCAALGVPSLVITYDSRLRMAARLGATTLRPSAASLDAIKTWWANPPTPVPQVDIAAEFDQTVERLKKFMQ